MSMVRDIIAAASRWWARWTLEGSTQAVGYEHARDSADMAEIARDYAGAAYWHGRAACRAEALRDLAGPWGVWDGIARGHLVHALRCREEGRSLGQHVPSMAYVHGWTDRTGRRVGPGGAL